MRVLRLQMLRMWGLYQRSRYTKTVAGWRKLFAQVEKCWNTRWGITAFRTHHCTVLHLHPFYFCVYLLPAQMSILSGTLPLPSQSFLPPPPHKELPDTCDINQSYIIIPLAANARGTQRKLALVPLLQLLFIHSFLIVLGFPVRRLPSPFFCSFFSFLFPFSSRPAWFLYHYFHSVGKKKRQLRSMCTI